MVGLKCVFAVAAVALCLGVASSKVIDVTEGLEDLAKEAPVFIKFYAPWCGHCKKLAPTWDELAEKVEKEGTKTKIAKIDCTSETGKPICGKYGVRGYPTLKMLYADGDKIDEIQYKGHRTLDSLNKFAVDGANDPKSLKTAAPPPPPPPPPAGESNDKAVKVLTNDDFDTTIKEDKLTFVKFYAPWCGHCKKLAPTWGQLADAFDKDDAVTIAKVDCTVHKTVCEKNGVKGYPTLKVFKAGGQGDKYQGGRDFNALKKFVEGKK